MADRVVIVTGASRGLGAAIARIAGEMHAGVVLVARSERDLQRVAEQVRHVGGEPLALPADVSLPADCLRVVHETVDTFGRIDGLVNNAGVLAPLGPVAEAEAGEWQLNWAVNVLGPVLITAAALPHLRAVHGRVVNISSGAAVHAISGWGAYCLSKAAINQFTRMLAAEEPDISAIALRPGVIDTDMQATIRADGGRAMPAADHARFVRYHEAGELLPPEAPGCAAAVLAFHAAHEWSGEFMSWDDERVQSLTRRYACAQR
ncbi:MAG: SDR family NAD(P)-dependent oxidoreductase [Anaerolineae bacterium]|nr:SDR family NAD(P)-dependent oxidoreductase [Anaerolineae bacterium]